MINKKDILNSVVNNEGVRPITPEEKDKLKSTLLEMTKDIDLVCRKYDIKMFLVGGSLLGAIRHGGFIPWDDDMDFGMMRVDYQKFIEVFDEELGKKYHLRCPNSPYPNGNRFMQIFKKGTVLKQAEGSTPLQPDCVFIDIFPYDYVPTNKIVKLLKGIYCNCIMIIASSVTNNKFPNIEYKNMMKKTASGSIIYFLERIIGLLFSWRTPEKWFNTVDNVIRGKNKTDCITSATGRRHYLGEIFHEDTFVPLKEIKFENLSLYAPSKPEEYLRHNYGDDYMVVPAVDRRESHFIKEIKF